MLPDFRFVIGATLATALLAVTSLGLLASVKFAHLAKVGPLESSRNVGFDDRADWNQFHDPDAVRRFEELTLGPALGSERGSRAMTAEAIKPEIAAAQLERRHPDHNPDAAAPTAPAEAAEAPLSLALTTVPSPEEAAAPAAPATPASAALRVERKPALSISRKSISFAKLLLAKKLEARITGADNGVDLAAASTPAAATLAPGSTATPPAAATAASAAEVTPATATPAAEQTSQTGALRHMPAAASVTRRVEKSRIVSHPPAAPEIAPTAAVSKRAKREDIAPAPSTAKQPAAVARSRKAARARRSADDDEQPPSRPAPARPRAAAVVRRAAPQPARARQVQQQQQFSPYATQQGVARRSAAPRDPFAQPYNYGARGSGQTGAW
jgi:hypothetical protein